MGIEVQRTIYSDPTDIKWSEIGQALHKKHIQVSTYRFLNEIGFLL